MKWIPMNRIDVCGEGGVHIFYFWFEKKTLLFKNNFLCTKLWEEVRSL